MFKVQREKENVQSSAFSGDGQRKKKIAYVVASGKSIKHYSWYLYVAWGRKWISQNGIFFCVVSFYELKRHEKTIQQRQIELGKLITKLSVGLYFLIF